LTQSVFDPENYGFWKCVFNKSCSCLSNSGHECVIYMKKNQILIKMYLYLKCSVKGDLQQKYGFYATNIMTKMTL
jgi:hypothetical protein